MTRDDFQALAAAGTGDARALAKADARALAALWLHAAAAAPERTAEIYDATAEGWLGRPIGAPAIAAGEVGPASIPEAFWPAFWALVDAPPGTLDAGGVTIRTAALTGLLSPELKARVPAAALAYPGVAPAAAQGWPERFTLEALARCPEGSLGGAFHSLIVDNGFDLEVLDREALGLSGLTPPLDYLNARILQCHDLWHIVGGYRTTGLHEVAISAFQLGQFGHHYSAMFLAMALAKGTTHGQDGSLLLDVIASAWAHGRESPPLLGVDWPAVWDLPVEEVRQRLGIAAYASPWPADLFEQLAAA
jgi:hypothetical protein